MEEDTYQYCQKKKGRIEKHLADLYEDTYIGVRGYTYQHCRKKNWEKIKKNWEMWALNWPILRPCGTSCAAKRPNPKAPASVIMRSALKEP